MREYEGKQGNQVRKKKKKKKRASIITKRPLIYINILNVGVESLREKRTKKERKGRSRAASITSKVSIHSGCASGCRN